VGVLGLNQFSVTCKRGKLVRFMRSEAAGLGAYAVLVGNMVGDTGIEPVTPAV
jgi:hypothetical protein